MSFQLTGALKGTSEVGVILPTYREAENIENIIEDIENLPLNTSILVIDDSSPDSRGREKAAGEIRKHSSLH